MPGTARVSAFQVVPVETGSSGCSRFSGFVAFASTTTAEATGFLRRDSRLLRSALFAPTAGAVEVVVVVVVVAIASEAFAECGGDDRSDLRCRERFFDWDTLRSAVWLLRLRAALDTFALSRARLVVERFRGDPSRFAALLRRAGSGGAASIARDTSTPRSANAR